METRDVNKLLTAIRYSKDLIASGYEKITVTGGTAQALDVVTSGKGLGALYAEIRVESATTTGIIMRYLNLGDILLPTTTDGLALSYLDFFDISSGDNVAKFRVIAVSGSHTLHVQYYK